MASGAAKPRSGSSDGSRGEASRGGGPRSAGRVIEYQAYIDGQLRKTRSRVKWVDLGSSLTLLAIGVLAYLLVAAVIDHWVVPGGLGFSGRLLLCIGLVGGAAYHLVGRFAPLLLRKVNPVYAAEAIERGQPMKNSLINFLLLRKQPNLSSESMLEAMKEQAAVRLSAVPADAPVDRTALIRLGYVLCAVLIAAVVYALAGPKDAIRSVNRVIAPWADLAPSTRVKIVELTPADVERRRDEVVEVKVRTKNMRATDEAVVFYSNSGKPEDDIAVPLRSDDVLHWSATIPGGSEGLKQDLYYYVRLGDTESPRYRIRVAATPVITVGRVQYEYPAYTGLPPRIVERQGDLKGLEGTRVVLTAETNQQIRSAFVAFDAARNRDVELTPDENKLKATGSFELALTKDRKRPAHTSYMLRFANIDGQENPKPIEHKIDVTADQAPEVKVIEPTSPASQELQVPLGAPLRITLAARDPDFKLADLAVVFERGGVPLREERMLAEPRDGDFSNTVVFDAARYGLKVGDRVTFRGRAKDNKAPQPNIAETARYTIVVVQGNGAAGQPPKAGEQGQPNQQQNNQPPGNQPQDRKPQQGNDPQQGKPSGDQPQPPAGDNREGNQQPNGKGTSPNGQGNQKGRPQNENRPPDQQPGTQQPNDPKSNSPQPNQQQTRGGQKEDSRNGQPQDAPRPGEGKQDAGSKPGENGGAKNGQDEKPIDPEVDPGKAIQELKDFFDKQDAKDEAQNKNEPGKQPKDEGKQNGSPGSGDKNESGNKQPSGKQPAAESANKKPDDRQGAGKEPGMKEGSEKGTEKGSQKTDDPNGKGGKPDQENGKEGKKNDGPSQPGGPSGAGKQSGGDEGKPGGDQQSGGSPSGKQSERPGSQAGSPGGSEGMRADDKAQGAAERREGKNDGGREVERKPTDGNGGEKPVANESRKPGDTTGAKPADRNESQPAGEKNGSEAPMPGTGSKPNGEGKEAPPKTGTANEGNPTPDREGKQSGGGDGGQSGSASSKPGEKSGAKKNAEKPGEKPVGEREGEKPSANNGQPSGNQKNPGDVGGSNTKNEGTPEAQETNKPRDKTGGADAGSKEESRGDPGKSPSGSKQESDAQGQSSGDRSGNGEEGGGMKSPKKGTGSAGSNTPGDQGSGAAAEEGDSVTGNKPGDKARGPAPSEGKQPGGKPSGEKGDGNQSRAGGDRSGGTGQPPADASRGDPSDDQANQGGRDAKPGERPQDGAAQGDGGGGIPKGPSGGRFGRTTEPGGDAANLDYTKKVTDLTLDRLKNQLDKGQVDPELLKKFGSREALDQFARKWDEMRRAAQQPGAQGDAARKQFQETLKGLGLQSRTTSQQGRRTGDDDSRELRGSRRSEPPAKFADQYRAYTTGIGQAPAEPAKKP
ncbi:MAG: hypothetical protein K8U03_24030 [Planctomycetia bacterium]|nr:hypothetical protein [Planctomycetia bacterium]